jgi:hypothetical protein
LTEHRSINAVAESFFATLKREMEDIDDLESIAAAAISIGEYIDGFYNFQRRHSAIAYALPRAVRVGPFREKGCVTKPSTESGQPQRTPRIPSHLGSVGLDTGAEFVRRAVPSASCRCADELMLRSRSRSIGGPLP